MCSLGGIMWCDAYVRWATRWGGICADHWHDKPLASYQASVTFRLH